MSKVTVIGLGRMGAALASAMHAAKHDLTVWNRSAARMRRFAERGVTAAGDAAAAVAASPVVVICIDNYTVTNELLGSADIAPLLAGRTIVQLSTGTPREAQEASQWMAARDESA